MLEQAQVGLHSPCLGPVLGMYRASEGIGLEKPLHMVGSVSCKFTRHVDPSLLGCCHSASSAPPPGRFCGSMHFSSVMKAGLVLPVFSWTSRTSVQSLFQFHCMVRHALRSDGFDASRACPAIRIKELGLSHSYRTAGSHSFSNRCSNCAALAIGQPFCFGATEIGSAMLQYILDLLWQLQQAVVIPVQRGAMVSSSALEGTSKASAICLKIWDLLWQLPQAFVYTCAVQGNGQLVCFGDNDCGSAMCQQIWDLLWQLPQAFVYTCALQGNGRLFCFGQNDVGSAICQQTWDLLWQLPQAVIMLVQCGAMVSSSGLEGTSKACAICQKNWDLLWQLTQVGFKPAR